MPKTKLMATKVLEGEILPIEAYEEAAKNFYFGNGDDPQLCQVRPFVIVTDGRDILVQENEDNQINIGWSWPIYKPKWSWKSTSFHDLTEKTIRDRFFGLWKGVRTIKKLPERVDYDHKQQLVRKQGVEYVDLDPESVSVHCTNRGTYSVTKREFFPVYFLVVPNTKVINFVPLTKDKPCIPVSFKWVAAHVARLPMTFISGKIMEMVISGEIILPVISQSKTWPNEEQ